MSGNILAVTFFGEPCYWRLVSRGEMLLNTTQRTGQPHNKEGSSPKCQQCEADRPWCESVRRFCVGGDGSFLTAIPQ